MIQPDRALLSAALLVLVIAAAPARGLETDQYTVPPKPLVDVGPQLQQHLRVMLQQVASESNIAYLEHRRRAKASLFPWDRSGHAAEAERMVKGEHLANALNAATGPSLIECELEDWLRHTKLPGGQHQFNPEIGDSIYGANPFGRPVTLQSLAPTINVFGHYCGTDKIGHMFDEGIRYYEAFTAAEREGKDVTACVRRALESGVHEENTFWGLVTVGVYSNADLAANYAGFKFYLNLTRPVMINGRRLPPMLVKREDLWEINKDLPRGFLRPFISDHFNESLNPSFYNDTLRETVRQHFPARATKWAAFYQLDPKADAGRLRALTTYYGEPYGHSGMEGVQTVADMLAPPARPVVASHAGKAMPTASARE